jgi:hypothetical protein
MDNYVPPSPFLQSLIDDDAALTGDEAEASISQLMALMRDDDASNRDWATLLLAQLDIDTADVRAALLEAADDKNEFVRAEAIRGLVQRDRTIALPLLKRELSMDRAAVPLFEAAVLVADQSLVENLLDFATESEDAFMDKLAGEALKACEAQR